MISKTKKPSEYRIVRALIMTEAGFRDTTEWLLQKKTYFFFRIFSLWLTLGEPYDTKKEAQRAMSVRKQAPINKTTTK